MLQSIMKPSINSFFRIAALLTVILLIHSTQGPVPVSAGSGTLVQDNHDHSTVLIHHWNFNDIPNDVDFSTTKPELLNLSSRLYGAFLSYDGARWDRVNDPTPVNSRETPYDEEDDRALRLRNPAGTLTIHLPTKGYEDVVLRYAIKRSSQGAHRQQISYSTDGGTTFTSDGLSVDQVTVGTDYELVELDFSNIADVDNNPGFQVRLTMAGEGSEPDNDSGNQRINNITLDGFLLEDGIRRNLIHYWEFDDSVPNDVDFPTGTEISSGGILGGRSMVQGAWLRYDGARWDRVNEPTPFNSRSEPYDEELDRALRLRNPSGDFYIRVPTTGHRNVVVRYVVLRSGSGAREQQVAYSTDGSFYQTDGLDFSHVQVGENYVVHELDFTGMEAVDDNPGFTIRIIPSGEGSEPDNEDGNQRFNHITVDASPIETSARDVRSGIPGEFRLEQNYPNPFNPATQIRFRVPEASHVTLDVFDITGRHVETLIDQPLPAGEHLRVFNAETLTSGIYLYKLRSGELEYTRSMMLVK